MKPAVKLWLRKDIYSVLAVYLWVVLGVWCVSWFNNHVLSQLSGALLMVLVILVWWPLVIPVLVLMCRDKETATAIGFTKKKVPLQILTGMFVATITLLGFVVLPEVLFGVRMGIPEDSGVLLLFLYQLLATALVEEIIFRGYLYKKLRDIYSSNLFAILSSSILFGFFHIWNGNLLQIVTTTLLGVVWCSLRTYVKHCTLLSVIIAHALHNTLISAVITLFFYK